MQSQIYSQFRKFKGTTIFVDENSRTELPFKKPDELVPIWKILKNFIGKDISRVSMPVILNEPLSSL